MQAPQNCGRYGRHVTNPDLHETDGFGLDFGSSVWALGLLGGFHVVGSGLI